MRYYSFKIKVKKRNTKELKNNGFFKQFRKENERKELDEIDRLENAVPIIEKALDEYWSLSPQAQNDILKSFVDKIIYTKTIANHKHHSGRDDASVEIFLKI